MKVIFVGPTIPDAASLCEPSIIVRRPAVQGDVLLAVLEGASVIGLIDGNFEYAAPVWHKEILFGLSQGVHVFGSSSMGALRAVECRAFGMVGIGEVYQRYASADLTDDSDVALVHAPAELGYAPLSIPLVNLVITLERMRAAGRISKAQQDELRNIAAGIFYKERTWRQIAKATQLLSLADKTDLIAKVCTSYFDVKRADGLELITAVTESLDQRTADTRPWDFHSTSMWEDALKSAKR
jgi:hypothetical protein